MVSSGHGNQDELNRNDGEGRAGRIKRLLGMGKAKPGAKGERPEFAEEARRWHARLDRHEVVELTRGEFAEGVRACLKECRLVITAASLREVLSSLDAMTGIPENIRNSDRGRQACVVGFIHAVFHAIKRGNSISVGGYTVVPVHSATRHKTVMVAIETLTRFADGTGQWSEDNVLLTMTTFEVNAGNLPRFHEPPSSVDDESDED